MRSTRPVTCLSMRSSFPLSGFHCHFICFVGFLPVLFCLQIPPLSSVRGTSLKNPVNGPILLTMFSTKAACPKRFFSVNVMPPNCRVSLRSTNAFSSTWTALPVRLLVTLRFEDGTKDCPGDEDNCAYFHHPHHTNLTAHHTPRHTYHLPHFLLHDINSRNASRVKPLPPI